jgi:transcriptional regulator GlxA family with amidase domain
MPHSPHENDTFTAMADPVGVTPYELTLRIRVQKAGEALIESDDKVASIAHAHGFCNQSTFTQHFRTRTGMTPKQFRVRHLGVNGQ